MPRLTKIYTRQGDDGTTALGTHRRVEKDDLRVRAYGEVDELNAHLGMAMASGLSAPLSSEIKRIQNELFNLGAELAFPPAERGDVQLPEIGVENIEALETLIDRLNENLGSLDNFILPGGSQAAASLHVARTVCRRAERLVVALNRGEAIGVPALPYLNRLSDALFVMARYENMLKSVPETLWDPAL